MYRGMLFVPHPGRTNAAPAATRPYRFFYIGPTGQEAGIIGAVHALRESDFVMPGLRECSAALYRGMPLDVHIAQIFGNANDVWGRQMPCHSGIGTVRHVTMSSCVSVKCPTQPGPPGPPNYKTDDVALSFLGDGGTSASDFHVALNFASVLKTPTIFVCQNNHRAISTPSRPRVEARHWP